MAARADAAYRQRKASADMAQLLDILQVAQSIDPKGAGDSRQELVNAPDRPSLRRKR